MVSKIRMNSSGLRMCLNFLFAPIDEIGVLPHCAARYPVDFTIFETAKMILQGSGAGKAGHLVLAMLNWSPVLPSALIALISCSMAPIH